MNKSQSNDIQCNKILRGLNELNKYLSEPLTREALDLDENLETTNNKILLDRLRISLKRYKDRGKDLVYVGFMGHFSTGKSSTINSILELNEEDEGRRNIGLNPVDKNITLITHSNNTDSIFNITKENLVSIRLSAIDKSLLENVVIADTPGTGDPVLIGEMAKDFLPICDLIIYCLSATSPLDSADKPFLTETFSKLNFIPVKFIVTRADEFKLDLNEKFKEKNFDLQKSQEFLGALVQRINQLFQEQNISITQEDIFLIDNKAQFNINLLKEFMLEFSDVKNVSTQINIHSHKIEYFTESSKSLRNFFVSFINSKAKSLFNLVQNAKENIAKFEDIVQVKNNSLTESWSKSFQDVQSHANQILEQEPEPIYLPDSFSKTNFQELRQAQDTLSQKIEKETRKRAEKYLEQSRITFLNLIEKDILDIKSKIVSRATIENLQNQSFPIYLSVDFKTDDFVYSQEEEKKVSLTPPKSLSDLASKARKEVKEKLLNWQKVLGDNIDSLKNKTKTKNLLITYDEIVSISEKSLLDDCDRFFEFIELYRSGVFSYGVKQEIAKLGLGENLDKLELKKLSETEKDLQKQGLQESLFLNKNQAFSEFSQFMSAIELELIELQKKHRKINFNTIDLPDIKVSNQTKESITKDIANELVADFSLLKQKFNLSLKSMVSSVIREYDFEINMERKKRKSFFMKSLFAGLIVALVFYLGTTFLRDVDIQNNVWSEFVWAIPITFVCEAGSALIANWVNDFPRRINITETNLLEKFRIETLAFIDRYEKYLRDGESDDSLDIDVETSSVDDFSQVLADYWKDELIHAPHTHFFSSLKINQMFENLKIVNAEYDKISDKFAQKIIWFKNEISTYFNDIEGNQEKLREFAEMLKTSSVDPSFRLIEETHQTLADVKDKIAKIDFI